MPVKHIVPSSRNQNGQAPRYRTRFLPRAGKYLLIVINVFPTCISQVYAKAAAPSKDHIEELNKETQHVVKTLTDTFHDVTGIKDTDEMKKVRETIHSSVNDLAEKMTGVMKTLGSEAKAHSGEVEQAINSLKEKFTEGVKKIQEDHPKEVEEVKKHQKKIEEFYNDAAARIKTTMEAINKDTEG